MRGCQRVGVLRKEARRLRGNTIMSCAGTAQVPLGDLASAWSMLRKVEVWG